jgi:nucleoid DNA-binding protein
MKIDELVQLAKKNDKDAFGDMPDKRVVAVVTAVLKEVNRQIETSKEPVLVNGFGRFTSREKGKKDAVEGAEGDAKSAEGADIRRRISFRPVTAKNAGREAGTKPDPAVKAARKAARAAGKKTDPAVKAARKAARVGRKSAAGKKSSA